MQTDALKNGSKQEELENLDRLIGWITGVDARTITQAGPAQTRASLKRIESLLARERNKGVARHWAYDFNRHVTLKRARDRLIELLDNSSRPPRHAKTQRRAGASTTSRYNR